MIAPDTPPDPFFVYACEGEVRCLTRLEAVYEHHELLRGGWRYTATIDPARWIESLCAGHSDPSDMIDELRFGHYDAES